MNQTVDHFLRTEINIERIDELSCSQIDDNSEHFRTFQLESLENQVELFDVPIGRPIMVDFERSQHRISSNEHVDVGSTNRDELMASVCRLPEFKIQRI